LELPHTKAIGESTLQKHILTQKKIYKHLSIEEREYIYLQRYAGQSYSQIAKAINRHPSTVMRELKRNWDIVAIKKYSPSSAQRQYEKRISKAHKRYRLKSPEIRQYVYQHLKDGWSPEIISRRLTMDHPDLSINHESIYQFIYKHRDMWIPLLARGRKHRRKRGTKRGKRHLIPNRIGIEHRSEEANSRLEIGHWEADTIVSKKSLPVLQVMVERKTRYVRISKMKARRAKDMRSHLIHHLSHLPTYMRKSVTFDNGAENCEHTRLREVLGMQTFFCNPYHSWEKGSVEQVNGLIRRYFPKGTDFSKISSYQVKQVEKRLNTRPRKCLGYKTPLEVLEEIALAH
jgi:IS30 family transposase